MRAPEPRGNPIRAQAPQAAAFLASIASFRQEPRGPLRREPGNPAADVKAANAESAQAITPLQAQMFCAIPDGTVRLRRRCLAFEQQLAGSLASKKGLDARTNSKRALANRRDREVRASSGRCRSAHSSRGHRRH
jgi:hypothetical protein